MAGRGEKGHISRAIDEILSRKSDRYHTPGHKGELSLRDLTEIGECGEIFPGDSVRSAEKRSAELYGVPYLRYLTGGSSMGIKAALLAFAGKKVVYAPGAHRAFFEGCALAGITPVPAYGEGERFGDEYTRGCGYLPEPLREPQARRALDEHPDCAALFITSPDCLGRCADTAIASLCRSRGVKLIADAAHGAHFAFAPGLDAFRFENIADIANMSAHKTLGAYTPAAVLTAVDPEFFSVLDRDLELLGTTSPNYALMESTENSVLGAANNASEYERLKSFVESLTERESVSVRLLSNRDYTRLCVSPRAGSARELYDRCVNCGIMPEAVVGECVVFILTPADGSEKLERLRVALCACDA